MVKFPLNYIFECKQPFFFWKFPSFKFFLFGTRKSIIFKLQTRQKIRKKWNTMNYYYYYVYKLFRLYCKINLCEAARLRKITISTKNKNSYKTSIVYMYWISFYLFIFFLSYSGKTHFYTAPIVIVRLSREKKMYFFIWYGAWINFQSFPIVYFRRLAHINKKFLKEIEFKSTEIYGKCVFWYKARLFKMEIVIEYKMHAIY